MSEDQQAAETPEAAATWYDTAPDEVKGYIQNKGWDDPIKAVASYQELEKFRGASEKELLKLPKDPEADGAFDEIYTRLGRPESPDKYEIKLPDGVQLDEARLNGAREIAHKLGLNNKQFEALAQFDAQYLGQITEAQKAEQAAKQEADYQALVKEWGANAGEREELSRRGLRSIIPSGVDKGEIASKIEEALGTALTLKLFANVGEKISREDKINDADGSRPFGYTREQALADRTELMNAIKADPLRLDNYNKGIGNDTAKLATLNKVIAS